ncbi:hypothetical protein [Actinomyces faecalis]|uniref:phage terminase small subunit n=1 Tax=Actinomyces faecalis TaxID=2722820 RepID=UPI001556A370|nr:hypothetical protein [Actinomyces faecalis]
MGTRGPVPKRSDERHRRNQPSQEVVRAPGAPEVTVPDADPEWHPIAQRLWEGLRQSGQARFYEPSDWALAYSLMEDLSRYKSGAKRSGQMLAAIMSGLSDLLVTEGDRRRVGIELSRPEAGEPRESAGVVEMNEWRRRLQAG